MKRLQMLGGLLLIPALALFVAAPGCGKKEEPKKPAQAPPQKDGGAEDKKDTAAKGKEAIKPGDGVIKGRVVYDGDPPKPEKLVAAAEHKDCKMAPEGEKVYQEWIVGKDKGVANVVVYLKPGANKYFEVSDADKKRTDTVTVDQPNCAFIPRVSTHFPAYFDGTGLKPSGQKFKVLNSAKYLHNTRWSGDPTKNPPGSENVTPGKHIDLDLKPQSGPVMLNCDVHKWMGGAVWVFDHPYSAVTKADGTFEIKGVPTGVEVLVFAWHEAKGPFYGGNAGTKTTFMSAENKLDLKISK